MTSIGQIPSPASGLPPSGPFQRQTPIPAIFGAGCSTRAGALLRERGIARALLLTDAGLRSSGLADPLVEALCTAGIDVLVHDEVKPNPRLVDVTFALQRYQEHGAQAIVALGGGSVLDSAKALAASLACGIVPTRLPVEPDAAMAHPVPPCIALPSTAGTGSESTSAALLKDEAGRKFVMRSQRARPSQILLDPALTASVPPGVTAASGWDVLMHAFGALGTTVRDAGADANAFEALARASRHLERAVQHPGDLQARAEMLHASYLAGLAISVNGVDAVHGLCTPLEGLVDRPHGHVLGVTFGPVARRNLPALKERYAMAARHCGYAHARLDDQQAAQALLDGLERLRQALGLPARLRDIGVTPDMLHDMPEGALASRATRVNAVPLERPAIAALYAQMG